MKKTRKLKNYIIWNSFLSIIIPIILIGTLTAYLLFAFIKNDISQKNTVIADTISHRLNGLVNESFLSLYQLRNLLETEVLNDDFQINTYLQTSLESSSIIQSLELIDETGIVKNIAPDNLNLLGSNQSGQSFFSDSQLTKTDYTSSIFISQRTGQPTLALSTPFNKGVVVAFLDLSRINLESLGLNQAFGDQISIAITDEKGTLISHDDMNKVYQRDKEENFEIIQNSNTDPSAIFTANYNGQTMLVNKSSLNNMNWFVFVYQSYASILQILRSILGITLLVTLLLVIISRVMAHFVFRTIDLSFSELNSQTKDIATGHYQLINVDNNFAEFETLTGNFNQMVERIKDRDETLQNLAYYDLSTNLPNDTYLLKHLEQFIEDDLAKIAVICFNIQNFKRINDTYGPKFGDAVLQKTGQRILSKPRDKAFTARSTSSNFIRVAYNMTNIKSIIDEIKDFQALFNEAIVINENKVYLRFYVGLALYPDHSLTAENLLQYAHMAADSAKLQGKRKIVFFETTMKKHLLHNMNLEISLQSALSKNQLFLHYQPQINVNNQEIRGFEALLRWQHPQLGNIPPLDFIGIAESTGLIIAIGEWVLKTACQRIISFNQTMNRQTMISVNISPIQMEHDGFLQMVQSVLEETGLNPNLLELEITENVLIHSHQESLEIFKQIKAMGVKLSLDDFGTGYSSLSYLKNLPIDTLKIDQAFTRDLLIKGSHENLMESMITMAHILKMKVIVEGVEELKQFDRLKSFCCDCVQGYYFSKPIPESELENYSRLNKL